MTINGHHAHPFGPTLITRFTVNQVTHNHANVYLLADSDLAVMQEILDWIYPGIFLTPARMVILTGNFNANCSWAPRLPLTPPSM